MVILVLRKLQDGPLSFFLWLLLDDPVILDAAAG
jgi:hypothetical protein